MNKICITCDTKNRLGLCSGKDGDFKYCYRKIGSLNGLEGTITPFNTIDELYNKITGEIFPLDKDSLKIENYCGEHVGILIGKYKNFDDVYYPIGFIIK